MGSLVWKVGELAARTGLSVRTLHYYDEIALLSPSRRTKSDHRLYTEADVIRLQQIKSLRQLGFSLDEIRDFLGRPEASPQSVIRLHLARLHQQLQLQQKLCRRLEAIAERLGAEQEVSVDDFLQTIQEIEMVEKTAQYFTEEQRKELEQRGKALGEQAIRRGEEQWKELIDEVRAEMQKGTDPTSQTVQRLAGRYRKLIEAFTGGNKGIEKSLSKMYQQEPDIAGDHGFTYDPKMFEYLGRAQAAANELP